MNQFQMQCLCCDKPLDPVDPAFEHQPSRGVICRTNGNYGSVEFDSFHGEALLFFVCDDCLAAKRGRILYCGPNVGPGPEHKPIEEPEPVPWDSVPEVAAPAH